MTTAFIYDPIFLEHITPEQHPERPQRLDESMQLLEALKWFERDDLVQLKPRAATVDELATVHEREYIQEVEAASKKAAEIEASGGRNTQFFATDTYVSAKTYEAALKAAGAPLTAIDALLKGEIKNAYCLVRPPGHHAVAESAMGFCIFNNVAVAARYALEKHGLERVMIIDYDVHHGNGTQEMFYNDPRVLYFSVHQAPFYPGTGASTELGEGEGLGTTINVPLPARTGFHVYDAIFRQFMVPAMDRFDPQLILVSAGFDAHWDDPIGDMYLSTAAFYQLNRIILEYAERICDGRVIMLQEGGYSISALENCVATSINQLMGGEAAIDDLGPAPDMTYQINIDVLISELRRIHNLTGYRVRRKPKPDIERLRREVKGPAADEEKA